VDLAIALKVKFNSFPNFFIINFSLQPFLDPMIHNLTSCLPSGPLSSHSQFGLQTTFKPQIKQGLHSSQRKASLKGVARTSAVSHKSSVKINKSAPKQFSQPTLHQFLDFKSPVSSFTDLSEGTLGDLLDLQEQSSFNNFQLESGHSFSTQTGGKTLRKRAQTSLNPSGSLFGVGTYLFAPKSLNQKRFLLEVTPIEYSPYSPLA